MLRGLLLLSLIAVAIAMTTDADSTRSSSYYSGAIIVFYYQDGFENVTMGSETDTEEVGKYGFHSPAIPANGVVMLGIDEFGNKDGCECKYETRPQGSWVALVERGKCTFTKKIDLAMKRNASAIIVYDDESTEDITLMSHEGASTIPAIMTTRALGREVDTKISSGEMIRVDIRPGERHRQEMTNLLEKASIVFVSISFMILMVISLAWLVFYYVQRFRLIQNQHRGQQHHFVATKKAIAKIPVKTLKMDDKEVAQEQACIICLESYKCGDMLRIIECSHTFHRKCIDPWLQNKQTCPMCKFDVVKGQASTVSTSTSTLLSTTGSTTTTNYILSEPDYEVIDEVESPSSSSTEQRPRINLVVVTTLQSLSDEETKPHLSDASV